MNGGDGIPRKVMIVIEDNGKDNFNIYLSGDTSRLKETPQDKLSAAEFWGKKLFEICIGAVHQTGAIERTFKRN